VESVNAYAGEDNRSDIEACYNATDWCINQEHNMIALPVQSSFFKGPNKPKENGSTEKQEWGDFLESFSLGLPAHNMDHWGSGECYNKEVTALIKRNLWDKIEKAKNEGKHPESVDVKATFSLLQKIMHKKISIKASRLGGQKAAYDMWKKWQVSGGKFPGAFPWWAPFSMASTRFVLNNYLKKRHGW
jgi:hypothetical protein